MNKLHQFPCLSSHLLLNQDQPANLDDWDPLATVNPIWFTFGLYYLPVLFPPSASLIQ